METKNQCDSCMLDFGDCAAVNVVFGNGVGNDNVVKCDSYVMEEYEGY